MDKHEATASNNFWWKRLDTGVDEPCSAAPKPGDLCPECGEAELDYDGLFVLICPACYHVAESGVFS
ncbi:MAG: hypothetical protein RRC07_16065 [Anaerolineae bacterium]|nr:hypothetical protein [Anaerolineae bacterium]